MDCFTFIKGVVVRPLTPVMSSTGLLATVSHRSPDLFGYIQSLLREVLRRNQPPEAPAFDLQMQSVAAIAANFLLHTIPTGAAFGLEGAQSYAAPAVLMGNELKNVVPIISAVSQLDAAAVLDVRRTRLTLDMAERRLAPAAPLIVCGAAQDVDAFFTVRSPDLRRDFTAIDEAWSMTLLAVHL